MLKHLHLADLVSLLNISFGFLAILAILAGEQYLALGLLFFAIFADGLDGIIARKTTSGPLGSYLEAMGDMTSLSISPLLFFYFSFQDQLSDYLLYIALLLYLITSVIRLSSFHILKQPDSFIGLPVSVSAITILLLSIINFPAYYSLFIFCLLSIAMISPIRFPKNTMMVNLIAVFLLLLMLLTITYSQIPAYLLLIALAGYCIFGPLKCHFSTTKKQSITSK